MPLTTDSKQLVKSLSLTFSDLLSPLEASIRAVWRGTTQPPEAKLVLDNQLLSIARRFVNLRETSPEEKSNANLDVPGFCTKQSNGTVVNNLSEHFLIEG